MGEAVRVVDANGVRTMTLCRPKEYNTITPQLRDELGAAIDSAQHDPNIRVLLLDAEGPAFCAGYDLGWATGEQAAESVNGSPRLGLRVRPSHDRRVCCHVGKTA